MTIKKYTGKTKEEAIETAKKELGSQVVIMNIKEIKPKGVLGIFKAPIYEVTAAMEGTEPAPAPVFTPVKPMPSTPVLEGTHFDAAADESFKTVLNSKDVPTAIDTLKKPQSYADAYAQTSNQSAAQKMTKETSDLGFTEQDLKSAFREINEVVEKSENIKKPNPQQKVEPQKEFVPLQSTLNQPLRKESAMLETGEQNSFIKMLYNILMDNEVDEKYVNQILDDLGNVISSSNSLDYLISNVYQKMVLKFGSANTITLSENRPKLVFVIGPTGVGKTTTIAKIASKFKFEKKKNVAFITTDTYRIAATDQLNVYAGILSAPLSIVVDVNDFNDEVKKYKDMDLVLVDTAGFSHKNQAQKDDLKKLLSNVGDEYEKEIYLVLSATTKYQDLKEIVDTYRGFTDFKIIFTKLDETSAYGNILNMKMYTGADLSYVTTGQNVPDDIEEIDSQKIVKTLLGGK